MWRSAVQLRAGLRYGGIAQLVEHLLCKQGVKSSNLFISTKNRSIDFFRLTYFRFVLLWKKAFRYRVLLNELHRCQMPHSQKGERHCLQRIYQAARKRRPLRKAQPGMPPRARKSQPKSLQCQQNISIIPGNRYIYKKEVD